jgi:putative SOS response-associated peptidase YedK
MCGRFSLCAGPAELSTLFQTPAPAEIQARATIFPSQEILVVLATAAGRDMRFSRWGMIPSWAKEDRSSLRQINARSETARQKPFFRQAARNQRCLIPMSGFYEWDHAVHPAQPRLFRHRAGQLLAAAGLMQTWGSDRPLSSCALLTRPARSPVAEFHDRMPVLLHPSQFERWLKPCPLTEEVWQDFCLGDGVEALVVEPLALML